LAGLEVKSAIEQELTASDGWSLDGIVTRLEPKFNLSLADQQLETIARTETAATLNRAQMVAIEADTSRVREV
jgi:hypothetical protein